MTIRPRSVLIILLVFAGAAGVRLLAWTGVDRTLPMEGLYVDEVTYARAMEQPGGEVFSRPPGMFALTILADTLEHPAGTRIALSILSLIPSLVLYLTFRRGERRWALICAGSLAVSPFLVFAGLQVLPAVPALVLVSLALLAAFRKRLFLSGVFTGAACLFRAELIVALPVLLLMSVGERDRIGGWLRTAGGALVPVLPILILNISAGGGPVIAENGGENLWLGSSWELLRTPPGVEFEQLVSVDHAEGEFQEAFLQRAFGNIGNAPFGWLSMGLGKGLAYFMLPGPGRNLDTGMLMGSTVLILLLPLSLLAISLGLTRSFEGDLRRDPMGRLAIALIVSGFITSFVFFPAARFRTAVIPAFWFLAAYRGPRRSELLPAGLTALAIILISLLYSYPGRVRPGLNHILAAEYRIAEGAPSEALECLEAAETSGFEGADLHNLRGVALMMTGRPLTGLSELKSASESAPGSPSVWRNLAVALWQEGRILEAGEAAAEAVELNPLLMGQLLPILEGQGNRTPGPRTVHDGPGNR